jgi:hypothetical protein
MRLLLKPSEQFSGYLAVAILSLLALNFLTAYQINQSFEPRFLFSGLLLACTAIFLRYGLGEIRMLHRASYRVATVMALWSLGFFIFPYPNIIIYLLVFPGFYFLFRIEMKGEMSTDDDIAAALILFVIALFLYVEQQPLHVLLFPNLIFDEFGYYSNAPAIVAIGIGLIRLQRWLAWPGLALTGLLCVYFGGVLTSSLLEFGFWKSIPSVYFAIAYGIVMLLAVSTKLVKYSGLSAFSHQSDEQVSRLQIQLYWVINFVLQACVAYLVIYGKQSGAGLAFMAIAPLALLTHHLRFTLTLLLVQWSLFVFPLAWISFPQLDILLMLPLALFLLATLVIRRVERYSDLLPNYGLTILCVHYYVALSQFTLFTSLGLVFLLFPFFIWMGIPQRPLRVKRQAHYLFWPPFSAVCILCIAEEFRLELLALWSLMLVYVPVMFYMLINMRAVQSWMKKRKWLFFNDWLGSQDRSLTILSTLSLAALAVCFVMAKDWFVISWVPVIASMGVFIATLIISIYLASKKVRLFNVYASEVIIWTGLALLRWKLDVDEMWRFNIVLEGYIFIAAGFVVAGLREVLKSRSEAMATHFARITYFYSVLGWLYILYMQLSGQSVDHVELSSLAMAALFYVVSRTQNRANLILVAIFVNAALLTYFYAAEMRNLQFYLVPTLSTVLILAHLFSDSLTDTQQQQIRLICGMVMIGSSSYFNILEFNVSLWYPVTASLLSALAVVLGTSLQIRVYLYLGFGFFVLNTFAVVVHTILNQPPEVFRLIVGMIFLTMGILFLGSYLLFQMKRQELLEQYQFYQSKIGQWH